MQLTNKGRFGAWLLAIFFFACPVHAQDRAANVQGSPLEQAEAAYLNVDFEGAQRLAQQALQSGGHTPPQLLRIYELLAICTAALGEAEVSRDYFILMLSLDPEAELDSSVPPRLRGSYFEARGALSARPGLISVEVGIDRGESALRVALSDPRSMAAQVRIHGRVEGAVRYSDFESEARAELDAPIPGANDADRVEYFIEVLDQYGNQLAMEGSPFQPRVVGRSGVLTTEERVESNDDTIIWVISAATAVLVAGAVTTGILVDQSTRASIQSAVSFGSR